MKQTNKHSRFNYQKISFWFLRISICLFLLYFSLIEFLRPWTNWPSFTIVVTPDQENLLRTTSIYDYLGNFSNLAYFTTLSNIIAVTIFVLSNLRIMKVSKEVKIMILIYMFVTTLVFWTTLAPFWAWGQNAYFDYDSIHEHLIVFVIILLWALFSKPTNKIKWGYVRFLIFPISYLLFNLIFYFSIGGKVATYPFLNFYNFFNLGLSKGLSIFITTTFIIGVALIMLILYWTFLKINILWEKNILSRLPQNLPFN